MRALDAVLQRIDRLALNAPEQLTLSPVCKDKLRGVLLGIAIGDALGNTSESYRPQDRNRAFGEINNYLPNRHADGRCVGLPSDDTQMSFWLLAHLLEDGHLEPSQPNQFLAWGSPCAGSAQTGCGAFLGRLPGSYLLETVRLCGLRRCS
jgi:hypothetical protein